MTREFMKYTRGGAIIDMQYKIVTVLLRITYLLDGPPRNNVRGSNKSSRLVRRRPNPETTREKKHKYVRMGLKSIEDKVMPDVFN